MKMKRKIIFFLALMSLFYCITLMQETYAKYISSANANADLAIARWNILINNQDIVQNSNFSQVVTPVFPGTTNIKSDVIAPTAEGYFDLTINGNNTDVSFSYSINVALDSTNTVTDLGISRYQIGEDTYNYNGGNIAGTIAHNDASKTRTIRFFVKWNDDPTTQNMDNAADSAASRNGIAAFAVNVNVIQLQ